MKSDVVHVSNKVVDRLLEVDVNTLCEGHRCNPEAMEKIEMINNAAKMFILAIQSSCPACADAQYAVRCVREARLWANSSISLHCDNWEIDK